MIKSLIDSYLHLPQLFETSEIVLETNPLLKKIYQFQ